jgi:hypothetical protein
MFNEIEIKRADKDIYARVKSVQKVEQIFPAAVTVLLERFKSHTIDNVIIRGLPVPEDLPHTPTEIKKEVQNDFPAYILKSIANFLGQISEKGIEHTIRFRINDMVNEETWHGHYQYQYSVFYCLRGDPNAKTYLFSANQFVKNAQPDIQKMLLAPKKYMADKEPFSLIVQESDGYRISEQIYDRSDFEKYVKDLDLPDVTKALRKISPKESDSVSTVQYLLQALENPDHWISYTAGDIAMYNESSTMRFSPSYKPSTEKHFDRWILSLSISK